MSAQLLQYKPFTLDGVECDATFYIETLGESTTIVFLSRSGASGGRPARNTEYDKGLSCLLQRIGILKLSILDIHVDSTVTKDMSEEEKCIHINNHPYPLVLKESWDQAEILRKLIVRAQRQVGRKPGAQGDGNQNKRLRIFVKGASEWSSTDLGELLAGWKVPSSVAADLPAGTFSPTGLLDARCRRVAAIVQRQGQPQFRAALIRAYGGKCAITGFDAVAALDAAHIVPYLGKETNHPSNGLLLRSDIHTLFDKGLLLIDPNEFSVILSKELQNTSYASLDGVKLFQPSDPLCKPSREALEKRWSEFSEQG